MLRDHTAVITGATSGIGLGLAETFAAAGCRLVVNGLESPELAEPHVSRLRAQGVEVLYHPADLADPIQCVELMAAAEKRFGAVDILVNNAGVQYVSPVEEFPPERWDAILAINLSAAFHTIRAALPAMQRRSWGRIINIASAHGHVASIHKAAYVAADGMVGLTKVVALENATRGITCNAICPGFVLTQLVERQIDDRASRVASRPKRPRMNCCERSTPQKNSPRSRTLPELATFFAPLRHRTLQAHRCRSMVAGWHSRFVRCYPSVLDQPRTAIANNVTITQCHPLTIAQASQIPFAGEKSVHIHGDQPAINVSGHPMEGPSLPSLGEANPYR